MFVYMARACCAGVRLVLVMVHDGQDDACRMPRMTPRLYGLTTAAFAEVANWTTGLDIDTSSVGLTASLG